MMDELFNAAGELNEAQQMVIESRSKIDSLIRENFDEAMNQGMVKIDYARILRVAKREISMYSRIKQ